MLNSVLIEGKIYKIPQGTFEASTFVFRIDNSSHGGGYHLHLYKFYNGKYRLTDIILTRVDNKIYAFTHCDGKASIDMDLNTFNRKSILKTLKKDGVMRELQTDKRWTRSLPQTVICIRGCGM